MKMEQEDFQTRKYVHFVNYFFKARAQAACASTSLRFVQSSAVCISLDT